MITAQLDYFHHENYILQGEKCLSLPRPEAHSCTQAQASVQNSWSQPVAGCVFASNQGFIALRSSAM